MTDHWAWLVPPTFPVILVLLKITLLLLIALAATVALHRAPAGSRHLVWLLALGALLVLPPLAAWGPLRLPVLPEPPALPTTSAITAASNARGQEVTASSGTERVPTEGVPAGLPAAAGSTHGVGSLLLGLWLLVALALAGRLVHGIWSVRRIVRRSRRLEQEDWQTPLYEIADRLELQAAPCLLQSDEVKMPFAAGMTSATIVLPAESEAWTADRRKAVLIHELGHVRRRDLIGHTLARIACALYWFHPLVWTAARRLRAESERACDDLALIFGARPSEYAEHLLDIVTCVRDHNTPAIALAMAHRREFEGRMLAILNPELARHGPTRRQTLSIVGALAVLVLVVGAAAPVPRSAGVARAAPQGLPGSSPAPADTLPWRALGAQPMPAPARVAGPVTARPLTPAQARELIADTDSQAPGDRAVALAKALRTDSSARVRQIAAWGLQRYSRLDVAQAALVSALGSDTDAEVREMAAWALAGARRNEAVSTALGNAIHQDRDATVRATAAWAAGTIAEPTAVGALTAVLSDSSAAVREIAAWSIGNCHPDRAPGPLVALLSDKNRDVRLSAAWALYVIGDPETVASIDGAFRHEGDHEVQEGLIRALGRMGDRSIDALQRLVSSPDSEIRTIAVTALAGGNATGPWPWPRPRPRPFP
jgi:beta-lactamase regulating signal transducer with metallopeptidase domain